MEEIIQLFKDIQNTSSVNVKKAIIAGNKDNEFFKKCLVFLIDTTITTGIAEKKYDSLEAVCHNWKHEDIDREFCECLDYIKTHNTGRDEDVTRVQSWCYDLSDEIKTFVRGMITKSIKLGISAKGVNKAIPNLIPMWEVQQAYPLSEKNEPKTGEWFALSQKLNGNNNGVLDGKCISRQGKEFTGMDHIISDINKLSFKDMFFNGELIRKNEDQIPDDENFQIGTGIINSDDVDKSCIKFVIYEMLPKEEFLNGESKLTYKHRREKYLEPLAKEITDLGLKNIEVVPIVYEGTDKSKIQELLEKSDNDGWEGLMLNKDTKWKNKRNNGILKVKSFLHADVLCIGVVEGEGKYKGTLGLINCDYKGFKLGVGSGFTDSQRDYYWNHMDEIIGKIVQIKYKGETKNKQGGLSVQFPIFEVVRNDKTEPSYN